MSDDDLITRAKAELESRAASEAASRVVEDGIDDDPDSPAAPPEAKPDAKVDPVPDSNDDDTDPVDDKAKANDPAAWIDDDVRELAVFADVDPAEFTDRDDFNRAMRIAAKSWHRQETNQRPAAPASPPASKGEEPATPEKPAETAKAKSLKEEAAERGYDDYVQRLAENQDRLLAEAARRDEEYRAAEQRHVQAEQTRILREAHAALDTLDAERYGTAFDERGNLLTPSKEAIERRNRVLQMADVLAINRARAGRQPLPLPKLVKLADDAEFAAENVERAKAKATKELRDRVAKRSRQRGGGGHRTASPPAITQGGPLSENEQFLALARDKIRS